VDNRGLAGEGKGSVLLVDDDPHILRVGLIAVRRIGFDALEASSLTEAVDVLTNHGRIGLVISDIQMPGGSGVDLFNRMKSVRNWASIPVAFMTGYTLSDLPAGVPEFVNANETAIS
jgi:DNA-binding NtrC family response regulator